MEDRHNSVHSFHSSSSSNASSPKDALGPTFFPGQGDTSSDTSPAMEGYGAGIGGSGFQSLRHASSVSSFLSLNDGASQAPSEMSEAHDLVPSVTLTPTNQGSTSPRKGTPTKTKSQKNNFAAFGQKLSTAASAAAHATTRGKSGSKDGGHTLLNGKMFRQSKTDLKALRMKTDLSIQTSLSAARSSIDSRSPMARTSKELDRIAALGSSPSLLGASPSEPRKHLHHPHISFRKAQSPATVLSSSASNSKLASEGSVYSFHNPSALNVHVDTQSFKTPEECAAFLASSWALLVSRTQPIFANVPLRIPVEDINMLVTMHVGAHLQQGGTALEMMERLNELLVTGMRTGALSLQQAGAGDILQRAARSWQVFFASTLPLIEAVFLPLQLDIEETGLIHQSPDQAHDYWEPLRRNHRPLSVRVAVLSAYRDAVFLPVVDMLQATLLSGGGYDANLGEQSSIVAAHILQCGNTLALIRSGDAAQAQVAEFLRAIRSSCVSRPRLAKDRRGLVLSKT